EIASQAAACHQEAGATQAEAGQMTAGATTAMATTHPSPATDNLTVRIARIEISATMAVVNEADKLRASGVDLVDFGAGEPHLSTPPHIKEAAIAAIQANFTKYTPVGGTAELRDAIVHRHNV